MHLTMLQTYLEKLLTDSGYDRHERRGRWIVAVSSYYRTHAALLLDEPTVLALPEKAATLLNSYEDARFVPLEGTPDAMPMGMALKTDEVLEWLAKSIKLPEEEPKGTSSTDIESLVRLRRGQEKLRKELFDYWDGACAVTGVKTASLLIASHIKPWSMCESAEEKLDPFNALLLHAGLDKAFDKGLISFDDKGDILLSERWNIPEALSMGIDPRMRLRKIDERHRVYLAFHRENISKL